MISVKVVRNFVKNEINYDNFPLAAIFGTPNISSPQDLEGGYFGGTNYGRQRKNIIINFILHKIPDNFHTDHYLLRLF